MLFGEVPHFGVFCCRPIAKGVRFGPFQGKVVNASEVKTYGNNSLMWEVNTFLGAMLTCAPLDEGTRGRRSAVSTACFAVQREAKAEVHSKKIAPLQEFCVLWSLFILVCED